MTNINLHELKKLIYNKGGFQLSNWNQHTESSEYCASSFLLNHKKIEYRVSKITPTKTGQFVTIWKRNKNGITEPYDATDDFDFIIITARKDDNMGQFIFPKNVLVDKGIITYKDKVGKRGIRVYPPWDKTTSNQAVKTQKWQTNYFLTIKNDGSSDSYILKKLLS